MTKKPLWAVLLAGLAAMPAALAQDVATIEFEPKVGVTGTRVVVKGALPKGALVKFGTRSVPLLVEGNGKTSFLVPEGGVVAVCGEEGDDVGAQVENSRSVLDVRQTTPVIAVVGQPVSGRE